MKQRITFLESVLLLFGMMAAFITIWFVFERQTPEQKRTVCHGNLTQIALAVHLYAQDADEKLPPTGAKSSSWGDVIKP